MGQKQVYLLLKELGGEATTKQVSELAREKYPDQTLHHYAYQVLAALEKWGYVKRSNRGKTWKIEEELDY
jgi:Fe2+ or Zn2+ uptake regulation protein